MWKKKLGQKLESLGILVSCAIAMCGVAILAYQGYSWFRHGYWRPLRAELLLSRVLPDTLVSWLYGGSSWAVVNKTATLLFDSSLALLLFIVSGVLILLVVKTFDICLKPAKEEVQVKSWRG
jgi:cation transport ATPase